MDAAVLAALLAALLLDLDGVFTLKEDQVTKAFVVRNMFFLPS